MTTWISTPSIVCREVHATHNEQHSSISGNPTCNARIAVPYSQLEDAVAALLGGPEIWPKATSVIQNLVCVSARVDNDTGRYTTDSNGEIINYNVFALLDLTYMARAGIYVIDQNGEDVFWNDEISPRIEAKPLNHTLLIWGNQGGSGAITQKVDLHSDEAPSKYDNGISLVHTIEGFDIGHDDLIDLVNTVHNAEYISPMNGRIYPASTLLLRSFSELVHYNFKSYRAGVLSTTLKLNYEEKAVGWNRFYRNDIVNKVEGYYTIHQNTSPYNQVILSQEVSHLKYLGWTFP